MRTQKLSAITTIDGAAVRSTKYCRNGYERYSKIILIKKNDTKYDSSWDRCETSTLQIIVIK
jgi:hypothetical protein